MGAAIAYPKTSHPVDVPERVDGGAPPPPRRRLARVLWKLYEQWEMEQECEISEDSE